MVSRPEHPSAPAGENVVDSWNASPGIPQEARGGYGAGHFVDPVSYCAKHWHNPAPDPAQMSALVDGLADGQVAVGVQSFVPVSVDEFRSAVTRLPEPADRG